MTVKELLDAKGREMISLDADKTVEAAISTMTARNVSAVLVTRKSAPVGIFTERDVLKAYTRGGAKFHAMPLEQAMTTDLIVAELDEDLCSVMTVMIEKGIRHMPVSEHGKLVGMLSIRDVVRTQIGTIRAEIHHLKDYVSGI